MKEVIIITGASSGFGQMTAHALGRAGHIVYATMRQTEGRNKPKADDYRSLSQAENIDIRPLEMDVSDQASVDKAIDAVLVEAGRIDVVVHNAGHMNLGPTEAFSVEQLAQMYDVNTLSTQRVNLAVLPHLRKQGKGLLVWVSSSSAKANWSPYLAPYFAAKAGMEQLAVSYSAELARFGIETSIIVPGAFTKGTNHFAHAMEPAYGDTAALYANGPTADLQDKVLEGTMSLVPDDADPALVADAIVEVVNAPFGQRPLRITIDPSQDGSEIVASVQDRIREDTLRRIGLADLLHPAKQQA
ncbi:SDR family oxidoreductase [Thalassospira marina]|uniref:Oxidoreductase n=1 Tax=Thalassospira marina TaxID=2048283 RepID=A0ABM6Q7Q7_9PROT|nr:SDR family oxidoreductase [Thalassospira marina]AUG52522.1 oxidoreductase [Thalassospira marina]